MRIHEPSLDELIKRITKGEIQLPKFQREFVWDVGKIHKLLMSLFKERPIGMATSWLQPQGHPHTEPDRFSIEDQPIRKFGAFTASPPVISLVLDGRQRITTLLHVFTSELHAKNSKYTHANRWFVNLDKPLGDDDSIAWCRVNKLAEERLDSVANALSRGMYPLSDWASIVSNSRLINSDATYAGGVKPDEETMNRRADALEKALTILREFKLPIAEISERFDLSEVCEIFEILNTMGTRISVFDLIHNKHYAADYNLRESRREQSAQLPGARLFGAQPEEFYSQLVTTCWIAASSDLKPKGKDGAPIESLKAKNLLQTPLEAYKFFETALADGRVSTALDAMYTSLGGRFETQAAPYPVSLTLFIATWLATETDQQRDRLCALFRAYYFRNSLLKRYTQGYLNKHALDLRFLRDTIRMSPSASHTDWENQADVQLNDHFASDAGEGAKLQRDIILDQVLAKESPDGAAGELYSLYLVARQNLDLLTGDPLDIFTASTLPGAVQLHHIFPKKFLAKTAANYPGQLDKVNCLANLVPLSRASNTFWSDKGPSTALGQRAKTWANSATQFERARIDEKHFAILAQVAPYTPEDIEAVWKARAEKMASDIFHAQDISFTRFNAP